MEESNTLPQLNPEEIRILGALLEKSKTTPETYPLTLNALVLACNQKSARNPVVHYDEETVVITLDSLKKKQFIGTVIGGGSRTAKYRHNLAVHYSLDAADLAVLCLLFLRGPLTAGELNSNASRLYEFDDLAEVQETLKNLSEAEIPFVKLLPRKSGQKEGRYCHLFAEVPSADEQEFTIQEPARKHVSEIEARLETVEHELEELKATVQRLMSELGI
jgi:uncharacterized protein YceH (UPF0502 family)